MNEKQSISLAHVLKKSENDFELHSLDEHSREVGKIGRFMAAVAGCSDWVEVAGNWHDLGKYRKAFQDYIGLKSGYRVDAHIEGKGKPDHSSAGAVHAVREMPDVRGRILAYLIAGHHTGLPDWNASSTRGLSLQERLEKARKERYLEEALAYGIPDDILSQTQPQSIYPGNDSTLHLWIRMMFSCLVDADFLDTEKFMKLENSLRHWEGDSLASLKEAFDVYMQKMMSEADRDLLVNQMRAKVLQDCREAAGKPPGVFTLSVPTGGGKTLSGLAFALEHAIRHKKQRIIIAIPFTSIIEQTVEQYRRIFGHSAVIEHHSNIEPGDETPESRLATENWDAPIIVTTNVQLLESLFAAKTSRCRKLHNIANSVIVLDEAQMLPPNFLQPILDVLQALTSYFGVTLVLSTATQPVFTLPVHARRTQLRGLQNSTEIVKDLSQLYQTLGRVRVHKPEDLSLRQSWNEVAARLVHHDQVLAIVNTRADCRRLFELMPKGTIHLSGRMCGQHRSQVIAMIKGKLKNGDPIRVISTQLVEAGVDIDFPVVYRALAGLDSLAQSAGRCNREGKLKRDGEWVKGDFYIFVPPNPAPKGLLSFGEQATQSVWYKWEGNPLSHELFPSYFRQYFNKGNLDQANIKELLVMNAEAGEFQFRTAAEKFKLIDDQGQVSIIVPFDETAEGLINSLRAEVFSKEILRQLQRYAVMVFQNEFRQLERIKVIEQIQKDIWVISVTNAYDRDLGLLIVDDLFSTDPAQSVM